MEFTRLGKTGMKVSRICLGCMSFGSPDWLPWVLDEEKSLPIIKRSLDLGINFFDTADIYSLGKSEEILGKALQSVPRDDVIIATKCWCKVGDGPNDRGLSRKHIIRSVERSLKNLKTDYIDLFTIHQWDWHTPIEETMSTLNDLVRAGKIRYIGASNVYAWQVMKANHVAQMKGYEEFVSVQNQYNLLYREDEREMVPMCKEENIALLPYSPLAKGYLTGKKRSNTSRSRSDKNAQKSFSSDKAYVRETQEIVKLMSEEKGCSMAQVGMAWLLHQSKVVSPIVGVTKLPHLEEAIGALKIKFTDEELVKLGSKYVPQECKINAP